MVERKRLSDTAFLRFVKTGGSQPSPRAVVVELCERILELQSEVQWLNEALSERNANNDAISDKVKASLRKARNIHQCYL